MLIAAFNAINVRLAARARRQPPPAPAPAPKTEDGAEPAAAS
jgi:electron transport complex protein RnfE